METLPSLFELTGQYLELRRKLEDADLDETTIADTIESTGIIDDFQQKAQGVEMVARSFEASDEAIKAEISRLSELMAQRRMRAQRLREYLKRQMEFAGIEKISSPLFTITIKKNPQSVDVFDARQLPLAYWRQPPAPEPTPDKVAIGKALKAGDDVPGARLNPAGTRLAIS
jgi:hypothetical protein